MTTPISVSPAQGAVQTFNAEFGAKSDLARYETLKTEQRVSNPVIPLLNQLQMDGYIPARTALLLKNNLGDDAFTRSTTQHLLYALKDKNKISERCFALLQLKLSQGNVECVYEYLYVLMLYTKASLSHDRRQHDPVFNFVSPKDYSEQLTKISYHLFQQEKSELQRNHRKRFLREWLLHLSPALSREAIASATTALASPHPKQFKTEFLNLIKSQQHTTALEKIISKEMHQELAKFSENEFLDETYLRLKSESYYKSCVACVKTLKESLANAPAADLASASEKCKKAYNGSIYLLSDSKNFPLCSPTRFAALTGVVRKQWIEINNLFNRSTQQFSHRYCNCQSQLTPTHERLADWPFNSHSLIEGKPQSPLTEQQLRQELIDPVTFQENQQKTIAIIGCEWGSGHRASVQSLTALATQQGYHPVTVNLPEVLISEDTVRNNPITKILKKNWSTGTLFNTLMHHKAFAVINFLKWFSKAKPDPAQEERKLLLTLQYLLKLNPEAVMTSYSAHNETLIQACQILGIPCIHIATDVDTSVETRTTPPDYDHFKMAVPFNESECLHRIETVTRPDQRLVSGPPLPAAFFTPRTEENVKQLKLRPWLNLTGDNQPRGHTTSIDPNKRVVIISNGKNGTRSPYPEMLAKKYAQTPKANIPIHLIVLCGKDNKAFLNDLEQRVLPRTNLPITLFTEVPITKMEEFIAMSSYGGMVIGKGGGSTLFAALSKKSRFLIDNVRAGMFSQGVTHFFVSIVEKILHIFGFSRQLPWEKVNSHFAMRLGIATSFKSESEFLTQFDQMINNDGKPFPLQLDIKDHQREITHTLSEMLHRSEQDPRNSAIRHTLSNL